jgi:hypothetical protein
MAALTDAQALSSRESAHRDAGVNPGEFFVSTVSGGV